MRAIDIKNQLKKYLKKFKIPIVSCHGDERAIRRCLVSGYFANAAKLMPDGSFKTIRGGQTLYIHPNSVLNNRTPDFVLYHEVVQTTKVYMREVTVIDPAWLSEIAPHFYEYLPKHLTQQQQEQEKEESEKPPQVVHRSVF